MKIQRLRDAARDQVCIVPGCGCNDGTIVLAHYFGPRRGSYGGGMSIKGHDLIGAHLCARCHLEMDTLMRDKEKRWEHSEVFLHYCALTMIRLYERGVIQIS